MKSLKYCENYHNVTLRHEVSICCWKNAIGRIAWHRGSTNLPFVEITVSVKHNKEKHSKMRYAFIDSHAVVRNIAERSSVPFLISPSGNILQNCSTVFQPEYWHWFNPQILLHFLSFTSHLCVYVCVYLVLCNFVTCIGFCIHHNSEDTSQCYYYKDHSFCPFITTSIFSFPTP